MGQAELARTEQTARQHGIDNSRRDKFKAFAQQPQIVIRPMKDEFMLAQDLQGRFQIHLGQGVQQFVGPGDADLQKAELFRVGVQAVRLGIHGDPISPQEFRQESRQLFIRINHARNIRQSVKESRRH